MKKIFLLFNGLSNLEIIVINYGHRSIKIYPDI